MKHKQSYVRLKKVPLQLTTKFTKLKWYPITISSSGCGYIINDQGGTYLLDLDLIKSNMVSWECKEVDVIL